MTVYTGDVAAPLTSPWRFYVLTLLLFVSRKTDVRNNVATVSFRRVYSQILPQLSRDDANVASSYSARRCSGCGGETQQNHRPINTTLSLYMPQPYCLLTNCKAVFFNCMCVFINFRWGWFSIERRTYLHHFTGQQGNEWSASSQHHQWRGENFVMTDRGGKEGRRQGGRVRVDKTTFWGQTNVCRGKKRNSGVKASHKSALST